MAVAAITNQKAFWNVGTCTSNSAKTPPNDGIIGFGFQRLAEKGTDSYIAQLVKQNPSFPAKFFLEMCVSGGGLWFGSMPASSYEGKFHYVPITHQNYYRVDAKTVLVDGVQVGNSVGNGVSIVDSGGSQWLMPASAYNAAIAAIEANPIFTKSFGKQFFTRATCMAPLDGASLADLKSLPTMAVSFGNGVVATVAAIGSYITPCDDTLTKFQTGIGIEDDGGMTLGWTFMNQFITEFDLDNMQIGFAIQNSCSPKYVRGGSGASITTSTAAAKPVAASSKPAPSTKKPSTRTGTSANKLKRAAPNTLEPTQLLEFV